MDVLDDLFGEAEEVRSVCCVAAVLYRTVES